MKTERRPYERTLNGKRVWYILWEGRQTWLGRFEKEALENWQRLKEGLAVIRLGKVTAAQLKEPIVRQIVDIYLTH